MKHALAKYTRLVLLLLATTFLASCQYDEKVETFQLSVQLSYPEGSISPYEGARVELRDAYSSVFVASTDAYGNALFRVPAGIYQASTNETYTEPHADEGYAWRYILNGLSGRFVVSPDSTNAVTISLSATRRRVIY